MPGLATALPWMQRSSSSAEVALIGSRWAIVSAGLSCQTSRQIRRHQRLFERRLGEPLAVKSGPFDWVVAGTDAVARAIASRQPFPESREDIDFRAFRPTWTAGSIHYWHDLRGAAGRAAFDDTRSKFRHKDDNLELALGRERVIAVVSNTQNNLEWMREQVPAFRPRIERDSLLRLRDSLRARAAGRVDVLLVTYADRTDIVYPFEGVHHVTFERDETEWGGDSAQWTRCFADLCEAIAPRERHRGSPTSLPAPVAAHQPLD